MRRFRVAVVHGVNLDQLGRRDPTHYGALTFRELERQIDEWAIELDLTPRFFQTNHEGALVEYLHRAEGLVDGIIINPGAWTHYAWAIRDALEIAAVPIVEVHLSDLASRETWRQTSVISDVCLATITGRGPDGYRDALTLLSDYLKAAAPAPTPRTGTPVEESLGAAPEETDLPDEEPTPAADAGEPTAPTPAETAADPAVSDALGVAATGPDAETPNEEPTV